MMLLSFIMGVSCLFFMSSGGLVLGIIYCTAGCALAFVPFALHKTHERFWGIVSIISIVSLMLLLIASFAYTVWLLLQTSRAQNEMNGTDGSPEVSPLLGMYAQKATLGTLRRLQESRGSMSSGVAPPSDVGAIDSQGPKGGQAFAVLSGEGVEAASTTSSTSTSSHLPRDSEDLDGELTTPPKQVEEKEENWAATHQTEADHRVNNPKSITGEASTLPTRGKRMKELVTIARGKADKILVGGESSFYPTVLRQSWESRENIFVSKEDFECLESLNSETGVLPRTEGVLRALLDWGLFCGYTRYSIAALRKWPVSCSDDCYFGKLNFSRYRNNKEKSEKQAKEFLEAVDNMTPAHAEACLFLATVTTCRIAEQNLDSAATTSMCIALVVSLALFFAAIKCLSDSIKFIRKDNKRMQRVAFHSPATPV